MLDQLGRGVTAYKFYTHQDLKRAALLGAVDAAETDAFRVVVVQDFERVAVEDGDDLAGEVQREYGGEKKEEMKKPKVDTERISSLRLKWRATIIIQLTLNEWSRKHSPGAASVHNSTTNRAPSAEIHNVMHEMPIIF